MYQPIPDGKRNQQFGKIGSRPFGGFLCQAKSGFDIANHAGQIDSDDGAVVKKAADGYILDHIIRIDIDQCAGVVGENTGEERDGLGRFYTYYTEQELTGLLAEAGLTVTYRREGCERGLSGKDEPWIALVAHA